MVFFRRRDSHTSNFSEKTQGQDSNADTSDYGVRILDHFMILLPPLISALTEEAGNENATQRETLFESNGVLLLTTVLGRRLTAVQKGISQQPGRFGH